VTIRTQTLLMVTSLLIVVVLATAGGLGWSSRQALLADTEAEGLVIARLLARSAAFGARVMKDVEAAIGEQMVVEATIHIRAKMCLQVYVSCFRFVNWMPLSVRTV
jgi:hypothetical protein